ncbi:hypothetical protein BDK88_0081 [Natrinema hispanicum]|uniref:Uracil DNA glycosylase superfamily protein n=1 Tax=Natrinema hispanicum TaxID=392421 RepID=A0A482YKU2_9EURY|nr:hypothetical protein [Natrinema hispanicum]RZV12542.1 hypothetical protein BDK88_0081 [Natrinema hispanicum]
MAEGKCDFFHRVWQNWITEGGAGPCDGCPAHWSIREDFPGDPETRTNSFGHRPFFGDGALTDVDVAILGHEPGKASIPEYTEEKTNHTQNTFDEVRRDDVTKIPNIAGTIRLAKPLFELLDKEFNVYWTQVKKCNEIHYGEIGIEPDGRNRTAEKQCAGVGGYSGHLCEELHTVDPKYVISLGKRPYELFCEVFDVESLGENFSRGIGSGNHKSGLRTLSVSGESFIYIPTAHPTRGVHKQTTEQLSITEKSNQSKTERYYEALAEDLIKFNQINT